MYDFVSFTLNDTYISTDSESSYWRQRVWQLFLTFLYTISAQTEGRCSSEG